MKELISNPGVQFLGGAFIFVCVSFMLATRGYGPPWFKKPKNRPAVYLIQSLQNPNRIKIGYTSRRVEVRMREIAAKNGPVTLLFSLRMPHAYVTEQKAHARMRRIFGVRNLGGEWYLATPEKARTVILQSAHSTKSSSRMRMSWPKSAKILIWKNF